MNKLMAWTTRAAIHAGTAVLWISIGAIVTLIAQDNLEAAQTLLNVTTTAAIAVITAAIVTWATFRARQRRRTPAVEEPTQPRESHPS